MAIQYSLGPDGVARPPHLHLAPRPRDAPWLKPALTATVVRDTRTNRLQMLSSGNLPFILANSSEYWDGASIWPLNAGRRSAVLAMYQQWRSEDLYCVGMAYDPVSTQEANLFRSLDEAVARQQEQGQGPQQRGAVTATATTATGGGMTATTAVPAAVTASGAPAAPGGTAAAAPLSSRVSAAAADALPPLELPPTVPLTAASALVGVPPPPPPPAVPSALQLGLGFDASHVHLLARAGDMRLNAQVDARAVARQRDWVFHDREPSGGVGGAVATSSTVEGKTSTGDAAGVTPTPTPASSTAVISDAVAAAAAAQLAASTLAEARLLRMQSGQIFAGLVAARYQPQAKMQDLIKDLDKAGVRFLYMASRSYRRVKPLAQKMGLETGWNCAISLMPRRTKPALPHAATAASASAPGAGTGASAARRAPPASSGSGDGGGGAGGGGGTLAGFEVEDEDEDFGVEGVVTDEKRWRMMRSAVDEQTWDQKAQLPHGVPEIRSHLARVDNVPLLVSLFTDSTPPAIAGMLRVQQENGETVLILCSALRKSSPLLFAVGDIAIGLLPPQPPAPPATSTVRVSDTALAAMVEGAGGGGSQVARWGDAAASTAASHTSITIAPPSTTLTTQAAAAVTTAPTAGGGGRGSGGSGGDGGDDGAPRALPLPLVHPALRLAATLASLHCAFTLPDGTSLHLLLKTIADSTRALDATWQFLAFLALGQAAAAALCLADILVGLPPLLPPQHALWLVCVILPLLGAPLLTARAHVEGGKRGAGAPGRMPQKRAAIGAPLWDILPGPTAPAPAPTKQHQRKEQAESAAAGRSPQLPPSGPSPQAGSLGWGEAPTLEAGRGEGAGAGTLLLAGGGAYASSSLSLQVSAAAAGGVLESITEGDEEGGVGTGAAAAAASVGAAGLERGMGGEVAVRPRGYSASAEGQEEADAVATHTSRNSRSIASSTGGGTLSRARPPTPRAPRLLPWSHHPQSQSLSEQQQLSQRGNESGVHPHHRGGGRGSSAGNEEEGELVNHVDAAAETAAAAAAASSPSRDYEGDDAAAMQQVSFRTHYRRHGDSEGDSASADESAQAGHESSSGGAAAGHSPHGMVVLDDEMLLVTSPSQQQRQLHRARGRSGGGSSNGTGRRHGDDGEGGGEEGEGEEGGRYPSPATHLSYGTGGTGGGGGRIEDSGGDADGVEPYMQEGFAGEEGSGGEEYTNGTAAGSALLTQPSHTEYGGDGDGEEGPRQHQRQQTFATSSPQDDDFDASGSHGGEEGGAAAGQSLLQPVVYAEDGEGDDEVEVHRSMQEGEGEGMAAAPPPAGDLDAYVDLAVDDDTLAGPDGGGPFSHIRSLGSSSSAASPSSGGVVNVGSGGAAFLDEAQRLQRQVREEDFCRLQFGGDDVGTASAMGEEAAAAAASPVPDAADGDTGGAFASSSLSSSSSSCDVGEGGPLGIPPAAAAAAGMAGAGDSAEGAEEEEGRAVIVVPRSFSAVARGDASAGSPPEQSPSSYESAAHDYVPPSSGAVAAPSADGSDLALSQRQQRTLVELECTAEGSGSGGGGWVEGGAPAVPTTARGGGSSSSSSSRSRGGGGSGTMGSGSSSGMLSVSGTGGQRQRPRPYPQQQQQQLTHRRAGGAAAAAASARRGATTATTTANSGGGAAHSSKRSSPGGLPAASSGSGRGGSGGNGRGGGVTSYNPLTGGVHAESLIRYGAFHDAASVLAGHNVEVSAAAAEAADTLVRAARGGRGAGASPHAPPPSRPPSSLWAAVAAAGRMGVFRHLRGSPTTPTPAPPMPPLSSAAAAKAAGFTQGIPPSQGLLAPPPPPGLPRHTGRTLAYAALLCIPAAAFHVYLYGRALAVRLQVVGVGLDFDMGTPGGYPPFLPVGVAESDVVGDARLASCVAWAQSLTLLSFVVWLITVSAGLLHRGAQPTLWGRLSPLRARAWCVCAGAALALQLAYSHGIAGGAGAPSLFAGGLPGEVWGEIVAWHVLAYLVGWAIGAHDAKRLAHHMLSLRAYFDTRLGMWSPR